MDETIIIKEEPKLQMFDPCGWTLGGNEITEELKKVTEDRKMFIEGLIAEHSITMIYANDGLGKSVLALQMALEGAHNLQVYGHLATPHRLNTLYYATERPKEEPLERIKMMSGRHNFDFKNIRISGQLQGFNILNEKNHQTCFDIIKQEKEFQFGKEPLHVIHFDPVYALSTGDMNSDKDVAQLRMFVTRVQSMFDCAIVMTHHENRGTRNSKGKRTGADFYGNKFLRAMCNTVYHVKEHLNGTIWVTEKDQYACAYSPLPLKFDTEFYLSELDAEHTPQTKKGLINKYLNECHSRKKKFTKEDLIKHFKDMELEVAMATIKLNLSSHLKNGKIKNCNPIGRNALYEILERVGSVEK